MRMCAMMGFPTRSDPGRRWLPACLLLFALVVQPLVGALPSLAQTPHGLSDEELRTGTLSALTSMARFVLTADYEMLEREPDASRRYWRPMLRFLEGRSGLVAVAVTHSWPTMPRPWVDNIDELLPGLAEGMATSLRAEGLLVREATGHRIGEIDPTIRGLSTGTEWRAPDGTLLAGCEVVRPGTASARDCTMRDGIEYVLSIGYPVVLFAPSMGTFLESSVTLTGPRTGTEAGDRPTGAGFTLRAERRGDTWVVSSLGPPMNRTGPRR